MTEATIAELLVETGHAHHLAFVETDGIDPEWPLWYADYLVPRLVDRGYTGTKAELVHFLVESDRAAQSSDTHWSDFYAARLGRQLG